MVNCAAQYRKKLTKNLRCCKETKADLLASFDRQLEIFLEDCPDSTEEELTAAIGPVEDMAADLMARVSEEDQARYRKRLLINRIVAAILVVVLLATTVYVYFEKEYSNIDIIEIVDAGAVDY